MQVIDTEPFEASKLSPISVVVCTYDRAGLLAGALDAVCDQSLNKAEYEVIVVDNNSTDNTRAVVAKFCQAHPNVRYFREERQGLSHARNRGWKEARGGYVAYIDDDCKVPEQWLSVAKEIIERVSPAVFGGPFYAVYNTPRPRWFKDSYGSNEPHGESCVLNHHQYTDLFGGNIFYRRSLLEALNGFDSRLGMIGRKIAYGEETALLRLISDTMPDQLAYYDPALYLNHLVHAKKMSMSWTMRSRFAQGRYYFLAVNDAALPPVRRLHLVNKVLRTFGTLTTDFVHALILRDRSLYPYVQNYLYERTFQHLAKLGRLYQQYQQITNNRQRKDPP